MRAQEGIHSDELQVVPVVAHNGPDEELVAKDALPDQRVALSEHVGPGGGGKGGGREPGRWA